MLRSFKDSKSAAQFVESTIQALKPGSRLTTAIHPGKSGGFYALTVIEELSDDTAKELELFSSLMPLPTSTETTQAGQSHLKRKRKDVQHDWKRMYPDPDYPDDLYDEEKQYLLKQKRSFFIMGFGFGVMSTIGLASAVAWYLG